MHGVANCQTCVSAEQASDTGRIKAHRCMGEQGIMMRQKVGMVVRAPMRRGPLLSAPNARPSAGLGGPVDHDGRLLVQHRQRPGQRMRPPLAPLLRLL